jgi:thiol-disulfide isomerase/thioredoxin
MRKNIRIILWSIAIVFLVAVIVFVNFFGKKNITTGAAQGEMLSDFSIACVDGNNFYLSEQKGKVVVINLWATWCIPCVDELPNFEKISEEFSGEVSVIAIHPTPITTDVAEWLSDYSYTIPFAVDEDGSVSELLNASTVLPQTIVIDKNGIVTYNKSGSLSYEELRDIVSGALSENT